MPLSCFSFYRSLFSAISILLMGNAAVAEAGTLNMGSGAVVIGIGGGTGSGSGGSFTPDVYYEVFALESGTLSLPDLPENGPWEIEAAHATGLQVQLDGKEPDTGKAQTYAWQYDLEASQKRLSKQGGISLRWYWNGERIQDMSTWLKDGNPGKGGSYRVEAWQTQKYKQNIIIGGGLVIKRDDEESFLDGKIRTVWRRIDQKNFEVAVRGHTPLPPGTPPEFTSVPDLADVVVVSQADGIRLPVEANAGEPFKLAWYRDGILLPGAEKNLRVTPDMLRHVVREFHCIATNSSGTATTQKYKLRLPIPPFVDFSQSKKIVREGETVWLPPMTVSDTPATHVWSGPALSAGKGRATVLPDGTLQITDARLEDAGDYALTVGNAEKTVTHPLSVHVLRLPVGTFPLRTGQVIAVKGMPPVEYGSFQSDWACVRKDGSLDYSLAEPLWKRGSGCIEMMQTKPAMGSTYRCDVFAEVVVPKSGLFNGSYGGGQITLAPFRASTEFDVRAPWEFPVMPEHALPPGRIGADYAAAAPALTAGAATAAVRYTVSGLPKGLKATPDGRVLGRPVQSGSFQVAFAGINAKGRTQTVKLPLEIAALPDGTSGEWLVFGGAEENSRYTVTFSILPTGAYSGRGSYGPLKGIVDVDAEGRTWLQQGFCIEPGSNLVTSYGSWPYGKGHGWRNIWSRKQPAGDYAGRYNFYAAPLKSPRTDEVSINAGYRNGSVLVAADGKVTTTGTSNTGIVSTSSFFLSPQRRVMHEHSEGPFKWIKEHLELQIHPDGQGLSGQIVSYGEGFDSPQGSISYTVYPNQMSVRWPELLKYEYQGRRYTPPPQRATTLSGYSKGPGANVSLTFGIDWNGRDTPYCYEPQTWLLSAIGKIQRLSGKITTTCKVHLPTGVFTGTVRFNEAVRLGDAASKYQGILIPQASGVLEGYGTTQSISSWRSLPVKLTPLPVE